MPISVFVRLGDTDRNVAEERARGIDPVQDLRRGNPNASAGASAISRAVPMMPLPESRWLPRSRRSCLNGQGFAVPSSPREQSAEKCLSDFRPVGAS